MVQKDIAYYLMGLYKYCIIIIISEKSPVKGADIKSAVVVEAATILGST